VDDARELDELMSKGELTMEEFSRLLDLLCLHPIDFTEKKYIIIDACARAGIKFERWMVERLARCEGLERW